MMLKSTPPTSPNPRYGCFNTERSAPTIIAVQDGWIEKPVIHPLLTNTLDDLTSTRLPLIKMHRSEWLPMACGHLTRKTDPICSNCKNRFDSDNQLDLPLPQFD